MICINLLNDKAQIYAKDAKVSYKSHMPKYFYNNKNIMLKEYTKDIQKKTHLQF